MAQDEGRFGRITEPKRCLAPQGIRALAPLQTVRESFYVYAALAPSIGKMTSLVLPYANTEMMNIFFETSFYGFFRLFYHNAGRSSRLASLKRSSHS